MAVAGSTFAAGRPRSLGAIRIASPFAVATGLAIAVHLLIGIPAGPSTTAGVCLILLLVGLPHGSFDIDLLMGGGGRRGPGFAGVLAIYLALGGLALAAWLAAPVLALVLFLGVSVVHFAEDWADAGVPVLAGGLALALFAAPAVANPDVTSALFVALTGAPSGGRVAEVLVLVVPSAFALGLVAIGALWSRGHRRRAVDGACAVVAMAVLPPLIGFALFFCLFHSPLHFGEALGRLSRPDVRRWGPVAVLVTLAAIGIAAALYAALPPLEPSLRLFSASFLTLSVLTMPHMAAPPIVAALRRRAAR